MYEALEHWNQYKQEKPKYPTKKELIAQGYEVPGGMILLELIEEEIKVIVVNIKGGFYKITTDVEGYYSSSTQGGYGDNVLNVVLDRIEANDGVNDLSEYELIIK